MEDYEEQKSSAAALGQPRRSFFVGGVGNVMVSGCGEAVSVDDVPASAGEIGYGDGAAALAG